MPHAENLIVQLNIANCIPKWVLINPEAIVSLQHIKALQAMGFHSSILHPPPSPLKSFISDLSSALGTIKLPIKLGNEDNRYIHSETFYAINAISRHNSIMSQPWQHTIGITPSTLYQVTKFTAPNGISIMELYVDQI